MKKQKLGSPICESEITICLKYEQSINFHMHRLAYEDKAKLNVIPNDLNKEDIYNSRDIIHNSREFLSICESDCACLEVSGCA